MPSMLSSGIPSVRRSSSSVFCAGRMLPRRLGDAVEAVHVVRSGERDRVELDRVAGAGRADRERALHREHELVVERQQLDEPVDRELRRRHRRLGDRVVEVDVLPLEALRREVVAEDARRAPVGERRRGAVLCERVLHPDEEVPAVRRDRGGLEREVLPHAVRRARRHGTRPARAGRRGTFRRASSGARTARSREPRSPRTSRSSSPFFVSVSPSGSRLNGAYGSPSGASSVVTRVEVNVAVRRGGRPRGRCAACRSAPG